MTNRNDLSGTLVHPAYRHGPHMMALVAAAFNLPLLFVGGSVTTYRVGMAVPDWPTTFGINMFLYDFWNAPFGVRVEHTHRLYGAAVGLATLGLSIWFLRYEPRGWIKGLGVLALVAVIGQGILGGTRVTQVSTFLAAVHGCTGQAFFGLMVALCVLTGRDWWSTVRRQLDVHAFRRRGFLMLALIYGQIVVGAWVRHYGTPVAVGAHALLAALVFAQAIRLAVRIQGHKLEVPVLVTSSRTLAGLAVAQVVLGIAAFVYVLPLGGLPHPTGFYEALLRTAHQTNAALLLAASVVLLLRACRHLRGQTEVEREALGRSLAAAGGAAPVSGGLEVVA
jgi:cytochrome c oxidase assembly protein subunit 15